MLTLAENDYFPIFIFFIFSDYTLYVENNHKRFPLCKSFQTF